MNLPITYNYETSKVVTSLITSYLMNNYLIYANVIAIIVFSIIVGLLHGDMSQIERNDVISKFKKKEIPILVATDVAGMNIIVL